MTATKAQAMKALGSITRSLDRQVDAILVKLRQDIQAEIQRQLETPATTKKRTSDAR
jgi:hypothetical protein